MTRSHVWVLCGSLLVAMTAGRAVSAQTPAPAPAAVSPPAAPLPSVDEVLKRYRAAIGGEEVIMKHTARTVKGTFEIAAQGIKGDL